MTAPKIRERELSPLQRIPDNYQKIVIAMDTGIEQDQDQDGIKLINAIDFLLEE